MSQTGHTKSELGCSVLYPKPSTADAESTVDVVAIPGLGAHPDWTWTYTSKGSGSHSVNWLKDSDMLPTAIPNARIMRFGYESTWIGADSIHQRLSLIGEQLLRSLEHQRRDCRGRPIVFIAHSMGGNVLQKALLSARLHSETYTQGFGDILKSTVGIIFLGTPFRGTESVALAQIFARLTGLFVESDTNLINQISSGSESLKDVLYDFCLLINQSLISLLCFFEQHKTDFARIARRKLSLFPTYREVMVDEDSACIDGFPKVALAADHQNMNKFQSPLDSNYILVSQEVQRLVFQAPSYLKTRQNPRKVVQDESLVAEDNQECLRALFVTNSLDDMSRIQSTKGIILEGSCSWVFGDLNYTNWLNSRHSRPLWIHGDPGKGKTMLTIAVIAELSKRLEHSDNSKVALAYFFCDDKDDRTNSAVAILRGLLYQILCQQPTLFGHLKSEYKKQGAKLFESRNALQALWRILQSTLFESSLERVYLIVDALDECDLDSRTVFLRLIEKEMGGNMTKMTPRSAMKWMLTSRNEPDIKEALLDGLDISLELNSNQVDVAVSRFIDVKVEQLLKKKRYSQSHQTMVQDTLKSKAEGTFLWVSLACAELEQSQAIKGSIRRALESLPRGLEGIYTQVLERVMTDDQIDGGTASEILKAVLVAVRPLTIYELACVAGLPKECLNDKYLLSEYVSQCRSLLTIRGTYNVKNQAGEHVITPQHATIHLVHQSAKDFLTSPNSKLLLSPGLVEEHAIVVRRCLSYFCSGVFVNRPTHVVADSSSGKTWCEPSDVEKGPSSGRIGPKHSKVLIGAAEIDDVVTGQHDGKLQPPPFLDYPIIYWMFHGREADSTIYDIFDVYQDFFAPESPIKNSWLRLYNNSAFSMIPPNFDNFTLLHFGAYTGIQSLVKRILDWIVVSRTSLLDFHIDTKDRYYYTALMYAAEYGHQKVVELLLESGADVEATNKWADTALILSVRSGNTAVPLMLLDYGASVYSQNRLGQTALVISSQHGQESAVKLLLQHTVFTGESKGLLGDALMAAAINDYVNIVQLLLRHGTNVNILNSSIDTVFIEASYHGHDAVADLLLHSGADIEASNNRADTALSYAASQGHEATVQLLLGKGACVDRKNLKGDSALAVAAYGGHTPVVQLLLKYDADVDSADATGCSPLSLAAIKGHENTCNILLNHGASLKFLNRTEEDAISAVCYAGLRYSMRLLQRSLKLWESLKLDLKDLVERLTLAARQSYDASTKVLLEHNVTVNTKIKEEDMARFYAKIKNEFIQHYRSEEAVMMAFGEIIDGQRKSLLLILEHRKEKLPDKKTEELGRTKPLHGVN